MLRILFFSLIFLLPSPSIFAQSVWQYASDRHRFEIQVDTSWKETDEGDNYDYYSIPKIEIFSKDDAAQAQVIYPTEPHNISSVYDSSLAVKLVDANFDGIVDLEVRDVPMMYLSTSHFWLYDSESSLFQADTFLAKLYDITFLPEQKLVHSYYHIGVSEFGHSLWQWRNGTLEMVISEMVMDNMHDGGDPYYILEVRSGKDMIEVDVANPYEFDIPRGEEMHLYQLYLKYKKQ